jgi:MFS transporter, ACS family, hexuronate transporter
VIANAATFITARQRWVIVGLLFFLSVINSLDRQTLSVMAPILKEKLGFGDVEYSYCVTAFLVAYGLGFAFCGKVLDKVGVKLGVACALTFWSIAGMLHALSTGWLGLTGYRFLLGLGESFNAPGGTKAIGEWIPKSERAFCMSLFSSGNIIGAIVAPPAVTFVALKFGWQWAFILAGLVGFVWLGAWMWFYSAPETHRFISQEEREMILRERAVAGVEGVSDTGSIWLNPVCWAFMAVKFLTDPLVYFFGFWLPVYLKQDHGFSLAMIGMVAWIPFLAADIGSMGGGAASDWLVRRGWHPKNARLRMMLVAACLTPFAALAVRMPSGGLAIACIAVVLFAQSFWMANLMTSMGEAVPRGQVGRLAAAAGLGGSISGVISTLIIGQVVALYGYASIFTVLGFVHLAGFSVLWWAWGRTRPAS